MFESLVVVGATGAVGRIVRSLLEERSFPYKRIRFLASQRSAGTSITFRGEAHQVELLRPEAFHPGDLVISSTPDPVAAEFIPGAVQRGAIVVDESGYWRMKDHVPLVVPEVNPQAIAQHQGIIASPNCSTTQMVVAMKPIHDAARIRRVVVSTYQATSGAGVVGEEDLEQGSRAALEQQPYDYKCFAHPIAFNLIPQIGSAKHEGYTSEEMKMVWETQKIFGDDSILVCPTCVRVPVTNCHSESILLETEKPLTAEEARECLAAAPGITVVDDLATSRYPMPRECSGKDDVFIGRIRQDISHQRGSRSGVSAITSARVPPPTPSRSPSCWRPRIERAIVSGSHAEQVSIPRSAPRRCYRMTLAYDGTAYCGWQTQPVGATIQGTVEAALQRIVGQPVRVVASGRTDAGVHARRQVASFRCLTRLAPRDLLRALNAHLPDDICVLDLEQAANDFHAIRCAVSKRYRYLIQDGPQRDLFLRSYCWYIPQPLDLDAMQQAAACLVGRHDFRSFEAAGAPRKTSIRTVSQLAVMRQVVEGWPRIVTDIQADGFLYNMVRNIVGSLVLVGRGKQEVSWLRAVLAAQDRAQAGPTAPACGLTLWDVHYE